MKLKLNLIIFCAITIFNAYSQRETDSSFLLLKSGKVQLNKSVKTVEELEGVLFNNSYYLILKSINTESIEQLKTKGVQIIGYLPKDAYIVRVPKTLIQSFLSNPEIIGIHSIEPSWKLDQSLSTYQFSPFAPTAGDKVKTELVLFPETGLDLQSLLTSFGNLVISIEPTVIETNFIVELSADNIIKLASFPFVQFIGVKSEEPNNLNYEARLSQKSNALYTDYLGGLKLNGENINIIMSDGGKAGEHIDLKGRIDGSYMSNQQVTVHPTQVAGTLTGAGNLNPMMRGQAWGAKVFAYEGVMGLHAFPNAYTNDGVTITSVSQGACCNTGYTQQAQVVDQNTLNHTSLINILGAGNSGSTNNNHPSGAGWGTIASYYQGAKNNIVVGAVDNLDYPENYSSKGPLPDGRLKPEVVAVGTVQTLITGNGYFEASGTSLSCPNTSGVLAQLYQGYKELHNGVLPHSGLMKAVLLNSADDLGNPGPDYSMGYGRINARKAYRALSDETYFQGSLTNGQTTEFTVQAPIGAVGVKVLLYWHDQPGSIMSSQDLVNDLDLVVTDPNGTDWKPWILDPMNANANAYRSVDHINNSEQVTLSTIVPGTYTFKIDAFDINLAGSQDFFVVYEFILPQIHVTHPQGGEAFAPGSDINLRWEIEGIEAYTTTTLEYSDNNGQSWNSIGLVSNYSSTYLWSAPWVTSGRYLIRATTSTGQTTTSDTTFSVLKAPINLAIDTVCLDAVTISWDPTWTANGYEVYKLGDNYMEYVGSTMNTYFTFSGVNTNEENWFSVRALGPNDAYSLRAIAIQQEIGEINCYADLSEKENSKLEVFPNPSNGELTIKTRSGQLEKVTMINSLGQVLSSWTNVFSESLTINIHDFEVGTYFLKVDESTVKIIKH